jgi:DNA repair protein RadA/Sms
MEQRILEAEKLGFTRMIIPQINLKSLHVSNLNIQLIQVKKVEEAFRVLFK